MHRFTSPLIVVSLLGSLSALAESNPAKPAALKTVAVDGAPKAIGPYSQGVIANGFLYTAGQIPLSPQTMKLVEGDIVVQTNRVFDNLEAILKGAGCGLSDVVKATVFVTDLADFPKLNETYAKRFGDHRPARATVQVAKLPAGATLEIDLVARVP
jgi:2-iminobutanoate/2-iminopropanoate deaminase